MWQKVELGEESQKENEQAREELIKLGGIQAVMDMVEVMPEVPKKERKPKKKVVAEEVVEVVEEVVEPEPAPVPAPAPEPVPAPVPEPVVSEKKTSKRTSKKQKLMWADPSTDACVESMRKAVQIGRQQKGFDGINEFRNKYEWHNIGSELKQVLDKYR